MDAHTEVDLNALHQAVLDGIATRFPDLVTVDDYRDDRQSLPLPACLVELVDLEPDAELDPGTEQLAVLARFEARLVLGFRTTSAQREIRKLAAAVGAHVHRNRWGLPIGPAEVTAIGPDDFSPELDQHQVWRVEWQQLVHLGQSVWDGSNMPARMVVQLGNSPYNPEISAGEQAASVSVPVLAQPLDPQSADGDWAELAQPSESGALYSHTPDTGADHEPDYQRMDGAPR